MPHFAPKRILVPLDLSAASPVVLRWAGLWAETYDAKLAVIHADYGDYPAYFFSSQTAALENETKHRRAALNSQLVTLVRKNVQPGVPHQVAVLEAHPVEAILKEAAEQRADLILMGSHGRSGLARIRLGSVAENVVRRASIPTLVVRSHTDERATPRVSRVLCPVKFTELGRRCLEASSDVAAAFEAQLVVLHSIEDDSGNLQKIHDQLCQWLPEGVRHQCDLSDAVLRGDPAEQILLASRARAVDLIVVGAQHRPFLEFTTLGATTERVMRHSEVPVLVLPEGAALSRSESVASGVVART